MNISKNFTININMWLVPLLTILILSNINQQNYETTLTKYYKLICCSKPGGCKKTNFWTLLQQLLKITENWYNEDILHHIKIMQFEQTYNTFKHWISNYRVFLLYIIATTITLWIPLFPWFLLPSPFPNTWYSSSSTTHQYNNPK